MPATTSITLFRTIFPEFAEISSDAQVAFWFGQAPFDAGRLGVNYDLAVMLFAAHNIVLSAHNTRASAKGALPGAPIALLTSKGAGGLSASYDVTAAALTGAGIYNMTSYGQRLWKLLEIAAMGGVYAPAPVRPTVFSGGGISQ